MTNRIGFHALMRVLSLFLALSARAEAQPTREVYFNMPGFQGNASTTIEDKLIELIRSARSDSQILVSLYTIDREPIVRELVEASKRGVDVRMVLDGGNGALSDRLNHPVHFLKSQLVCQRQGAEKSQPSEQNDCIHFCEGPLEKPLSFIRKKSYGLGGSCKGLAINHNKFFLFSSLDTGDKSVVAQTSSNMKNGQLKMYNDLLVIKNDEAVYQSMKSYWNSLKEDDLTLLRKAFPDVGSDDSPFRIYFFPRFFAADPVLALLERVSCRLPGSLIYAAQSAFTRPKIADKLSELQSQGCEVKVVTRMDPKQFSPSPYVLEALETSLINLPFEGPTPAEQAKNSIHTKLMLIHAALDGAKEKTPIILTGSHNLDLFSLKTNDETLMEIHDPHLFEQYKAFFLRIIEDAKSAGLIKEQL